MEIQEESSNVTRRFSDDIIMSESTVKFLYKAHASEKELDVSMLQVLITYFALARISAMNSRNDWSQ